jgi:hypothetical protein
MSPHSDKQKRKRKKTPAITQSRQWLRNKALAARANVSTMTLWRWKTDPKLKFPKASVINGVEYNNVEKFDAWMRKQQGSSQRPWLLESRWNRQTAETENAA